MGHVATRTWIGSVLVVMALAGVARGQDAAPAVEVATLPVPHGGILPQVVVGGDGTVHMTYYKGEMRSGDIFYIRSTDGGKTFTRPITVGQPGTASAIGTVRGPHLAVGRDGRAHVVWIGTPQDGQDPHHAPLFYTRLDDSGTAFEPQRNVIQKRYGVDSGASVGADDSGNVYVVWHAPGDEGSGEPYRRVWVARSTDEGKSFSVETMANKRATGACECCGMQGFTDRSGNLYVMYRSASKVVNRDTWLLASADGGESFRQKKIHAWEIGQCMMSAAALTDGPTGVLAAWETRYQVYFGSIDTKTFEMSKPIRAPGRGPNRKHPAIAANERGEVALAWSEGTSWGKGGAAVWQVFDKDGKPIEGAAGRADDLPAWSVVAVFARPGGGFTVVY